MDYKGSADLATLLRINKSIKLLITAKSLDAASSVYQSALQNYFSQNTISFKRFGKYFPLTLPLKFVKYDESLLYSPHQECNFTSTSILNIFFINVTNVDDYRSNVRHQVSEWFAGVSSRPDVQWLIVVDSTAVKEKKTRSTVLDKIRADFAKHANKVIEVCESVEHGSFSTLLQAVERSILSHLTVLLDGWESFLKTSREGRNMDTWDVYKCINDHLEHARFYWSVGALEHALKLYDELDAFLFHTILHASKDSPPSWLALLSCPLPVCPILSSTMPAHRVEDDHKSFIGVRHILLSQQLLLSLCIYQQRLRTSTGVAPSIRIDFAGILIKYAHHCWQTVVEHGTIKNLLPCDFRLAVWTLHLTRDVFALCGLLADPSSVDGSAIAAAHLNVARFDAVLKLSELYSAENDGKRETILKWINKLDPVLTDSLSQRQSMFTQVQRAHDVTTAFLSHFKLNRLVEAQGRKLFHYLSSEGKSENAEKYLVSFSGSLLSDGTNLLARKASEEVVASCGQMENALVFAVYLALAMSADQERNSEGFQERLLAMLDQNKGKKISPGLSHCPVQCSIASFGMQVFVPGDSLTLPVRLTSSLSLPSCSLTVVFQSVTIDMLDSNTAPTYEIAYSATERKSAITCVNANFEERIISDQNKEHNSLGEVVCESSANVDLKSGQNVIEVSASLKQKGFYLLHSIILSVADYALVYTIPASAVAISGAPLSFIVQKTPNKIDVQMPKVLIAGVSQRVNVCLEAGARHIEPSKLKMHANQRPCLRFKNSSDEWAEELVADVPEMEKGERFLVEIDLCCAIDGSRAVKFEQFSEKMFVDWEGQTWPVDLSFQPLFIVQHSPSQLECKMLVESELTCSPSADLRVNIVASELRYSEGEQVEGAVATVFHTLPQAIQPGGVTGLVWCVGEGGDEPLRCSLSIRYSVESGSGGVAETESREEYTFEEHWDVDAPKVGYELCSQMLSQQPGAQLCRAGSPCHMVISIRSLSYRIESLYVVLDADERLWNLQERSKVVQMKESGLGQVAFTVLPATAGFLPYPHLTVYSALSNQVRSGDGFWSDAVEYTTGKPLISFQRTASRQIRVLGGIGERLSMSEKDNHKGGIRQKLGKLF